MYKLNYTVNEKMRTYYASLPDVIQVAEHTFVERRVLELFKTLSLLSWTSATNAAHVYDQALSQLPDELQGTARYHLRTGHRFGAHHCSTHPPPILGTDHKAV